jgi:hypothetical protein
LNVLIYCWMSIESTLTMNPTVSHYCSNVINIGKLYWCVVLTEKKNGGLRFARVADLRFSTALKAP